jgi:hypothetical protein
MVWQVELESTGDVTASNEAIFACDWRGNVSRFALADGKRDWTTNLTHKVWREDIESLPAKSYDGPTYGVHPRCAGEEPLKGTNVAAQATVKAGGMGGWFGTGRVLIDAKALTDDKVDDLTGPWLSSAEQYKAGNHGRFVWVELAWDKPIDLIGVAVHEDQRHREAWPYEVCLQVWKDGQWEDIAASLQTGGPWHNLKLDAPRSVQRVRYCVTGILNNNVWTDEIRVLANRAAAPN